MAPMGFSVSSLKNFIWRDYSKTKSLTPQGKVVALKNILNSKIMQFFWVFISVEIASLFTCLWAIRRLYKYINRYRFDETVYTLLFGFMHLRYFVFAYLLTMSLAAFTGAVFAFSLLDHELPA